MSTDHLVQKLERIIETMKPPLLLLALSLVSVATPAQTNIVYAWRNFVGQPGGPGSVDGAGSTARFQSPNGVAMDTAGNVYVADSGNHVIRKVTLAGVVTTVAGKAGTPGTNDGASAVARFNSPAGVALDSAGNLFVADCWNHTIRKITPTGVVTTLAGRGGTSGSADGTGGAARFYYPGGVAVDSNGNACIADYNNHTIRKVTPLGAVTTLAGKARVSGTNDGTGSTARFHSPASVAVDSADNFMVADYDNHAIRQVTSTGVVTTLAGWSGQSGTNDGTGHAARFNNPNGVAVDSTGNILVADWSNHAIRQVTSAGVVTTLAGSPGVSGADNGTGSAAQFNCPSGIAVDSTSNVFVSEFGNSTIRQVTSAGAVTTLAGSLPVAGSADGTGSAARFGSPWGVAVDSAGNVFVSDYGNSTIRQVTSAGVVTTLAGSPGVSGTNDAIGSAARFNRPCGLAVDSEGDLLVADEYNHAIRKVTPARVVTTVAGSAGTYGTNDGLANEARFRNPRGIAVDSVGNAFVADSGSCTIRTINLAGMVTTPAGNAAIWGGTNDGTGSAARFFMPQGLVTGSKDNLFVADTGNSTVRQVTTAGVVTTLAGSALHEGGADGAGPIAQFNYPAAMAVDNTGNLFVADSGNNTIRRISPAGMVTTIGGVAGVMGGADGIGSFASFSMPSGIAVDNAGNVFVADRGNNRITKGTILPSMVVTKSDGSVTISWPSAATGFSLQQNTDASNAGGWQASNYMISDDGTSKGITIPSPTNSLFFRLVGN